MLKSGILISILHEKWKYLGNPTQKAD